MATGQQPAAIPNSYGQAKVLSIWKAQCAIAQAGLVVHQKKEIKVQMSLDSVEKHLAIVTRKVNVLEGQEIVIGLSPEEKAELAGYKRQLGAIQTRKTFLENKLLECLDMEDQIVRFEQKLLVAIAEEEARVPPANSEPAQEKKEEKN